MSRAKAFLELDQNSLGWTSRFFEALRRRLLEGIEPQHKELVALVPLPDSVALAPWQMWCNVKATVYMIALYWILREEVASFMTQPLVAYSEEATWKSLVQIAAKKVCCMHSRARQGGGRANDGD